MKKLLTFFPFFALVFLLYGCGESQQVSMVKNGNLHSCPNVTVEEMVNSFMGNPTWESGQSSDGEYFVNIGGDITLHEKPVRAVVQFIVHSDSFSFQAFDINDVPQSALMASALLGKMCESSIQQEE